MKLLTSFIKKVQFSLPILICFILNKIIGHSVLTSFLNTIWLVLSLLFFRAIIRDKTDIKFFNERKFLITAAGLGFIPVFLQIIPLPSHLLIISFAIISLFVYFESKYLKYILILLTLLTLLASFYTLKVINFSSSGIKISFSDNNALVSAKEIANQKLALKQLRDNLLTNKVTNHYVANVFYNNLFLYYPVVSNAAGFLAPANFYNLFLIANLYPFIAGLFFINKMFKNKAFIWLSLASFILVAGIYIYNNNPGVFYFFVPAILSVILLGLTKVNIKIYNVLLVFSVILYLLIPGK